MTTPNETAPATILIVDDESVNVRLLQALLGHEGYVTRTAATGEEALAAVADDPPDLILLDVMMPGLDGRQVARALKAAPSTSKIPIIMVTAQTEREARLAALDAGAEDFLSKPVDRAELWLRVRNLLRLKRLSDILEEQQVTLEAEALARTAELQARTVDLRMAMDAVTRDITERSESEGRLEHLAHFDALTGLLNRKMFCEALTKTLVYASDTGGKVAVLYLDLDKFKNVNDAHDLGIGDKLLIQVGDRLRECVRDRDTVGRLGGDEFALILTMLDSRDDAAAVAEKIQTAFLEPFNVDGHHVTMTASIGVTMHPEDATDTDTLLKYADTAMYQVKQSGRDAFQFFTSAMNTDVWRRLELETALRHAVKNAEFVLHFQPKVALNGGQVVGLEAVLCWDRPGFGLVPSSEFIYSLEESGLIFDVGRWTIAKACHQIGDWSRRGIDPVPVSVNLSERQLVRGDLEEDVLQSLEFYKVPARLLELELTETLLMTSTDHTIATLANLHAAGVQITIDDFGTGHSSPAYLRRFPIDKLKIDSSFIRNVTRSSDADAITLASIRMGHSLDLQVIAEGVETAPQLAYLRGHDCDQIQGAYFSPALPVSALEAMLLAGTSLTAPDHPGTG